MLSQNLLRGLLLLMLNFDADKRVGDSLVQIWKLKFVQTLSTRFGQGFKIRRDFEAKVWLLG